MDNLYLRLWQAEIKLQQTVNLIDYLQNQIKENPNLGQDKINSLLDDIKNRIYE